MVWYACILVMCVWYTLYPMYICFCCMHNMVAMFTLHYVLSLVSLPCNTISPLSVNIHYLGATYAKAFLSLIIRKFCISHSIPYLFLCLCVSLIIRKFCISHSIPYLFLCLVSLCLLLIFFFWIAKQCCHLQDEGWHTKPFQTQTSEWILTDKGEMVLQGSETRERT